MASTGTQSANQGLEEPKTEVKTEADMDIDGINEYADLPTFMAQETSIWHLMEVSSHEENHRTNTRL